MAGCGVYGYGVRLVDWINDMVLKILCVRIVANILSFSRPLCALQFAPDLSPEENSSILK